MSLLDSQSAIEAAAIEMFTDRLALSNRAVALRRWLDAAEYSREAHRRAIRRAIKAAEDEAGRMSSPSLDILREQGPLTLRELTRATSIKMGWSLMYDDVAAVMARHLAAGEVCREQVEDYRDDMWTVVQSGEGATDA